MSDQVERKKSYRWASASQQSYDGADWDSSDDEKKVEGKLPELPKLDYIDDSKESLTVSNAASDTSLKRTATNKTMNEDLENLMVQISKEMTPELPQSENFEADDRISDEDDDLDSHVPVEYFQKSFAVNELPASDGENDKSADGPEIVDESENKLAEEQDDDELSYTESIVDKPEQDKLVDDEVTSETQDQKIEDTASEAQPELEDEAVSIKNKVPENSLKEDDENVEIEDKEGALPAAAANEVVEASVSDHKSSTSDENDTFNQTSSDEEFTVSKNGFFEDVMNDSRTEATSSTDKDISREEASDEDSSKVSDKDSDEKKELSNDDNESWRPDTDSFRSGFVQDTEDQKVPEGFVIDEDGKLVDLTPSGMKKQNVDTQSNYTRATESVWNAFPSDNNNEEIETIRDTKTIYDNTTLYNVPGLISNPRNLPPLPENAAAVMTTTDAATPPSPNVNELAKLNKTSPVPHLDLNKLLNSKSSHSKKLQTLFNYHSELEAYDTGLQIWISHSLKSNPNNDANFLFEEYKVSKHVKHAYANADELSRKNTVINTVDTVTQNVNHLKRKVFSHSIKSKGIFASIGKKKI